MAKDEHKARRRMSRRDQMTRAANATANRGGWRGSPASLEALAKHRPARIISAGRPCQREGCKCSAVRGADLCRMHGGRVQAINRDPTGEIARRYVRRGGMAKNIADKAQGETWRALPDSVRQAATRWAMRGRWRWPDRFAAAVALAAYVQGDPRPWQRWLAGARAKGIAGAIDPAEVASLEDVDA